MSADEDDNRFPERAEAAGADYIVDHDDSRCERDFHHELLDASVRQWFGRVHKDPVEIRVQELRRRIQ